MFRKVDNDRTLVAVCCGVIGRIALTAVLVGHEGRPPDAGVVAVARLLDLDDIGAEITQQLPGPGTGKDPAQIQNANMRKCAAICSV